MKELKPIMKMLVSLFLMTTVCVMLVSSLLNLIIGNVVLCRDAESYPWIAMLTGLIGTIPSLLLYFKDEPSKAKFYRHVILHFIMTEALILAEGALLKWYDDFRGAAILFIAIFIVYALVWLLNVLLNKTAADDINKALQNINHDEE